MLKSLSLQAELSAEFGACVFDVTLDCEDGAPIGGEKDHAEMVAALANQAHSTPLNDANLPEPRVAARVHPVDHPCFEQDLEIIVGGAGRTLSHLMVPKVESLADVTLAAQRVAVLSAKAGRAAPLPLHVLIESPLAVRHVFDIAAHPQVQSISFGLMDFVSAHGGAIPASAMGVNARGGVLDQFTHPLVLRAKLEISSACHAHGKVPAHCVVTEFSDMAALQWATRQAASALGYTRMWSIHPAQIRPILEAFSPANDEIHEATDIIMAAQKADWAPVSFAGKLHDRASYRYFWTVLERAHQTGRALPREAQALFAPSWVTPL